jgi:hypothetical protein
MFRHARLVPLLAVAMLAACKPSAPAPAEGAAVPPAPAEDAATPTAEAEVALPETLKVGSRFPEARAALAAAGWLPLLNRADCMARMGDRSGLCYSTPELASCAGVDCTLDFANADTLQRLSLVVGAPALSDEEQTPEEQTPAFGEVKSWSVSTIAAARPAGACPATDFESFLKVFSADPLVRARYTAPLVRVAQVIDRGDAGDQRQETFVPAANYTGFALSYRDGAWYPSLEEGAPPPAAIDVRVTAEAGGAYDVSVPGGVEGVSYRFERDGDCWRLSADPDAAY